MSRVSLPEGQEFTKINIELTQIVVHLLQFFGVSQAVLSQRTNRSKQLVSKWSKGERGARGTDMKFLIDLLIESAVHQKEGPWELDTVDKWYSQFQVYLLNLDSALLEVERAYARWLRAHIESFSNFIEQENDELAMTPMTREVRQQTVNAVNRLRGELLSIWPEVKLRNRRLKALYDHDKEFQSLDDKIAYIPTALEVLISMLTKTDAELEVAPPPDQHQQLASSTSDSQSTVEGAINKI